jgi:UPF0716 family protein affecting phage T7 exclusion
MTVLPPGSGPVGPADGGRGRPRWLLAAALGFVLVEVVVLIRFADRFGVGATAVVLTLSALLGLALFVRVRSRSGGRGFDLASGLLLLVPGLISSVLGLLLLTPVVRSVVRARLWRWARRRGLINETTLSEPGAASNTVIVMEPLESHDQPTNGGPAGDDRPRS